MSHPYAVNHTTPSSYTVDLWCSSPDEDNDDCMTGEEFETLELARAYRDRLLSDPASFPDFCPSSDIAVIVLDGPGTHEETRNPDFDSRESRRARRVWAAEERSEARMQAAMEFGVRGWNDYEGC